MTKRSPPPALASSLTPPRKLGPPGMALWNRVQAEYGIADIGGIEVLCQICQALDDIEALTAAVERDGRTIHSPTGVKAHPALRDILGGRAFIVRSLAKLGVTIEPVKPMGRPGSGIGITWEQLPHAHE